MPGNREHDPFARLDTDYRSREPSPGFLIALNYAICIGMGAMGAIIVLYIPLLIGFDLDDTERWRRMREIAFWGAALVGAVAGAWVARGRARKIRSQRFPPIVPDDPGPGG
jgi:uncharacterized membrane protein YsdA (DUF1294 family)